MIVFMTSTEFPVLLKALEKLKIPTIVVLVLSFMYRYVFVITDELMKMKQAKESRSIGGSKWLHIRTLANMIGTLFIRSYERAERVYVAMRLRGFNGSIKTLHTFQITNNDICFLLLLIGGLTFIRITTG